MKIRLGKRQPLTKKLLLVEGIARAGKFLLANVLSGFEHIEPVQLYGLLEQIPVWANLGLIDRNTAKEILRLEIDTHCYEMLTGRNFNYRVSDKSSIFNIPRYQKYLARSKEKDIDKIMKEYDQEKPFSFFIMHELMPYIGIYFETFFHGTNAVSVKDMARILNFSKFLFRANMAPLPGFYPNGISFRK